MKRLATIVLGFLLCTSTIADNTLLVGNIGMSAIVDQIGGAAITIPIEVPAGVKGMQPNLSLVYNSHRGYGLAGWGWDLAGISSIQRTGKTFYHDNTIDGIRRDNTDNLLLDGERLLLKSGSNLCENSTYRTEHESFSLITMDDYQGFTVQTKDGHTLIYGDTDQSQLTYGYSLAKIWYLSKAIDCNGNYITYTYSSNGIGSETYISKIEYSGNNNETPVASIEFSYEDIPHERFVYDGEYRFSRTKILKSIRVKSAGTLLYTYLLTYDNTDVHSKLVSVMKAAANGDYYNPTNITWNTTNTSGEVTANVSISRENELLFADFTGDGLIDIFSYDKDAKNAKKNKNGVLYTNTSNENGVSFNATSFTLPQKFTLMKVLDYNGDGRKDLAGVYDGNRIACLLFNGTTFSTTSSNISAPQSNFSVGDFDGDGRDEIIPVGVNCMYRYGADAISFTGITTWSNSSGHTYSTTSNNAPLDFNGNGKTDLLIFTDVLYYIYEYDSQTTTFLQIASGSLDSLVPGLKGNDVLFSNLYFGDFNGDGSTDLLYLGFDTSIQRLITRVFMLRGDYLIEEQDLQQYIGLTVEIFVNDFNNDGISDIAYFENINNVAHLSVGINNCDDFVIHDQTFSTPPSDFGTFFFEDIRGTGRADFVMFNNRSKITTKQVFTNNAMLVDKVTDGMGNTYDFTYKSITNSAVYTNTKTGANHILPLVQPFYVVSDYTAPYTSLSYQYKNGRCHTQGKGFLGFEEITTTDHLNQTQKKDIYTVNVNYMYHHPSQTIVTTLDGNSISNLKYNYTIQTMGGKCIFPYISRYEYTDSLTTLKEIATFVYDDNGNLDNETKIRGNRLEHTQYGYINIGSWCPNRLYCSCNYQTYDGETSPYRCVYYQYDSRGNMTRQVVDTLEANYRLVNQYTYDTYGNVTQETISGSDQIRTSSYTYSDDGRFLLTSTDELGQVTTYTYDTNWGTLLSQTTNAGTTTNSYDVFGQLKQTVSPNGVTYTTSTDFLSDVPGVCYMTHETCTNNPPVTTYYNAVGMPLYTRKMGYNDREIYTVQNYYPNGQTQSVSEPFFSTSIASAASQSLTSSNATFYTYDDYGRLDCIEGPEGITEYTYNGLNTAISTPSVHKTTQLNSSGFLEYEATGSDTGDSKKVSYTYYPTGQVKTATPDGGSAITMEYDVHGNRTKLIDPDAGTITNSYNAFGQVLIRSQSVHSSTPVVTAYEYEASNGQLKRETTTGDTVTTIKYSYNETFKDKPYRINGNGGHYYYTYDDFGNTQVYQKFYNKRSERLRTYYDKNLIARLQMPRSNNSVYYTYDVYGNMTAEEFNSTLAWELLEQNARGQVVRERKGGVVTTYTYDNCGRITSIVAPNIVSLHYTYDTNGNVLSKTDSINNQSIEYTYDFLMRLTSWTVNDNDTQSITYDGTTGNIVNKTDLGASAEFSYDSSSKPHALRGVSGVSGTSWGDTDISITYTDFNKVKSIERGTDSYEIFYGVDGERSYTQKNISGAITTRQYMPNYEFVVDSLGNETYIIYLCNGSIAVHDKTAGTKTLYHGYYDAQGSLIALTDNSSNVIARYAYDPWGGRVSPTDWTQSADAPDVLGINRGYTMHEHLDEFELINMNGRVYDPAVAQFLSPDPYIQDAGNWLNYNRYAYCYNNPTRYVDPSGEIITETLVFAGIMAIFQGSVNLGMQMYKGNVNGFWDGAAAFGIGAVSGAASSLLGGVTYGLGGFWGGFVAGAQSSGIASFLQGLGNQYLLGDKELEPWEVIISALSGGVTIGITNGCYSYFGKNASFWNGKIKWPPNNGALDNTTEVVTLQPGTIVDRYGELSPQSRFAAEYGTPISARSLNIKTTNTTIYNKYLIVGPIENVEKSIIAPWFDSPGMGTQYAFPEPISVLIEKGLIKIIK